MRQFPIYFEFQGAHIVTASHFALTYRLGYKMVLLCVADGHPRPRIFWYKDGAEVPRKQNVHVSEFHFDIARQLAVLCFITSQ